MKCAMVSFIRAEDETSSGTPNDAELVLEVLEKTKDMELVLFSGWTLANKSGLDCVMDGLHVPHQTFVLEVGNGYDANKTPESPDGFYVVQDRKIVRSAIKQRFRSSEEANDNENNLISNFLGELEKERRFDVCGKRVRLVICGENNILRNMQSRGNRVYSRAEDKESRERLESILDNTKVFLNPAHTPMGNLGKMKKRWEHFSKDGRMLLFATNEYLVGRGVPNLHKQSLSYAFADGKEMSCVDEVSEDKYRISRVMRLGVRGE